MALAESGREQRRTDNRNDPWLEFLYEKPRVIPGVVPVIGYGFAPCYPPTAEPSDHVEAEELGMPVHFVSFSPDGRGLVQVRCKPMKNAPHGTWANWFSWSCLSGDHLGALEIRCC